MKKIVCTLALSLAMTTPAFAQSASTASVKELLKITKTEQLIDQAYAQLEPIINSTIDQIDQGQDQSISSEQKKALEIYSKKVSDIFKQDLAWAKLEPDFIKIYSETYTQEEVDGMIQFYKTPVGQSTIDKMSIVSDKSMQLMQNQMIQIMPKISRALEQSLQEAKK